MPNQSLRTIFPKMPSSSDLAFNSYELSNVKKAEILIDLIKQRHAELNPRAINNQMTEFLGGTSFVGAGFATGLHRLEDAFILEGLESSLKKIFRGQSIKILEQAAGTSFPSISAMQSHAGHPWLARTVSIFLQPYGSLAEITVADKHADSPQFILRDGKGRLTFFSFNKNKANMSSADYTSFDSPADFDRLLKFITKEQAESLVYNNLIVKGAEFFLRPLLDPDFEARFNLRIKKQSYFDYPKTDSEKFDYIFSRHSIQKDNPHYLSEHSFKILVEATRRQLTADGEARLVFDHPYLPKACLVVRQDSYTTRHIMPVIGAAF